MQYIFAYLDDAIDRKDGVFEQWDIYMMRSNLHIRHHYVRNNLSF